MKTKKLSIENFKENQIEKNQKRSISAGGGYYQNINGQLIWVWLKDELIGPNGGGVGAGSGGVGIVLTTTFEP